MATKLEDLSSDQLRRIFRDYLKGIPPEKIIKKQQINEPTFWAVVEKYAKRKHPNDVGNAKDIAGPTDLLASSLDTGSEAHEGPLLGYSPKDLRVPKELHTRDIAKAYDYDSPEEKLRQAQGALNDEIAKKRSEAEQQNQTEAKEQMKASTKTTGDIIKDLEKKAQQTAEQMKKEKVEELKDLPTSEEQLEAARELRDKRLIADQAGEAAIEKARADYAEEHAEDFAKQKEAGEKLNEKLAKEETEAREKEVEQRQQDHEKLRKEAEDAERKLAELSGSEGGDRTAEQDRLGSVGADGPGDHRQPSTEKGAGAGPSNPSSTPVRGAGKAAGSEGKGRGSAGGSGGEK